MLGFSDRVALFATTFLAQGVRIGVTLVLARFLTEGDYGKYTLVTAAAGMVMSLGDFGVYRVVTTRQDWATEAVLETATVVTVVLFGIYALVAVAAGAFFAWHYQDQNLLAVGVIYALTTAASGYYNLRVAALARALHFARWARLELVLVFVTAVTALGLVMAGAGVFALAVPHLIAQLVTAAAVPRSAGVRWPRQFDRAMLRSFLSFGWKNAAFQYVNTVPASLANLIMGGIDAPGVVGKEARKDQVGFLSRAINVKNMFGFNLAMAIDRVLFPLMCKHQDEPTRFADLFVRGCLYIFTVAGFGAVGYFALAPDLIRVMFGTRWMPVAPLLQILSAELFVTGFSWLAVSTVMIYQRPLAAIPFGLVQLVLVTSAGWVYMQYGPAAFCVALTASTMLTTTWFCLTIARQHGVSRRRLIGRLLPVVLVLALAGIAMAGLRHGLWELAEQPTALWPSLLRLAVCGVTGLGVAALGTWLLDRQTYREICALLARRTPEAAV